MAANRFLRPRMQFLKWKILRPRMQFLKWKNMREASSELVRQFGCSSSDKGIFCGFGRTGDVSISSAEIAHAVNA
ncbi:hypothetical protein BTH58_01590, partial [Lactobacillus delbrueckii subsp. bulgaricus]|nr:hypothetical protein [Lactobacillus delbrueckii subsp. bulgaricus]